MKQARKSTTGLGISPLCARPHKRPSKAKSPQEKTDLQRAMKMTDDRIDALVYELYGLTEEEIRIVEETTDGR